MSFGYQQQRVLQGVEARAAILNLDARHNRFHSDGDRAEWAATFKHTGATITIGDRTYDRVWDAFDGGTGRLVTVDHEIAVDGVNATQRCVAIRYPDPGAAVTGTYSDVLVYERGGWYFASRILRWDNA